MSGDDQGGAGRREVAYRVLAAEFEDADFSYSESDEERAPNYVVTPTGARVNRLFVVGVLTEVEQAGEEILRARVVDPTGAFVVYAGQYQPDAQAFFERAEPPAFVAVTGKARTFQPDDSDVVYTSVRPENVNEVTAETRDRWNVGAARQTIDRVGTMAGGLARGERGEGLRRALESEGVDAGLAAGIPLAVDHYGTTAAYLDAVRSLAVEVAEVVAGERDEVDPLTVDPDDPGDVDPASLATADVPTSTGGSGDFGGADPGDAADASVAATETDGADGSETPTPTGGAAGSDTGTTTATDSGTAGESTTGETAGEPTATEAASEPTAGETAGEPTTDEAASEPTAGEAVSETTARDPTGETVTGGSSDGAVDGSDAGEAVDAGADVEATAGETGGADSAGEIGDFEPGEFDLDEEERESVEEEYGTEFTTGTEVDDPGEADIETPDPDATTTTEGDVEASTPVEERADATAETGGDGVATTAETADGTGATAEPPDETGEADDGTTEEGAGDGTADDGTAEDVDLDTAVMEAMRANDGGEGAPEAAIVAAVTDRLDVDEDAVADALQDALMGGQCYEPEDGVYKPI